MLSLARKLASKSQHKQHHHACIITKGSKIIATGYNHKFMHAEMDALRKVVTVAIRNAKPVKNIELYSFRWRKGGGFGNAKPCTRCMALMYKSGSFTVDAIYFTNVDGKLERL